jgi:hypothetical protein
MSQSDTMPHAYTADHLVEQPALRFFAELGGRVKLVTTEETWHHSAKL